jgi:hypothetical protein
MHCYTKTIGIHWLLAILFDEETKALHIKYTHYNM